MRDCGGISLDGAMFLEQSEIRPSALSRQYCHMLVPSTEYIQCLAPHRMNIFSRNHLLSHLL